VVLLISLGTQQLSSVPYALNAGNGVPVGTVCAFEGNNPPLGWLLCNGDTVNQTTYKNLFAVLGRVYGNGNGISTFKLPDYRGQFLRGTDGLTNNLGNTSNNDPDRFSRTIPPSSTGASATGVGSYQGDLVGSHDHSITIGETDNNVGTAVRGGNYLRNAGLGNTAFNSTGNETRPKNVYVNYFIKY
jgi:microcystin-dependent protein